MKTEFYLELRKKAEELFPSDEKKSEEYVEGFVTKVASVFDHVNKKEMADQFFSRGIAAAAGKALVGGVAAAGFAGLAGAINVVKAHALYNKYLQALDEATKSNAVLRAADRKKLMNFGNTIFKFAPHVATDSNMLTHVLSNAVHGDSLDAMTIRMLTELESRYQETKEPGMNNFNPKSWL